MTSLALIGGMAKGDVFRSILATVLNRDLWLPSHPGEATSRGAAVAGAVALGVMESFEDARSWISEDRRVGPKKEFVEPYDEYFRFYHGLYPALKGKFREAAKLP
jgi:xylulokinase